MGIPGLLHFLEKATRPVHVSEFKGATVAIDAYSWLAKGSLEAKNIDQVINYCIEYVQLLQYNEIRPILVFNGQILPLMDTSKRKMYKEFRAAIGAAGFEQGAKSGSNKQNIKVGMELATTVIKKCHEFKIDCIVAPYEAAAQLAFFNLRGIAELVITDNPDLILYGCSKICLQLDIQGAGLLLDSDLICDAIKMKADHHTFDKFKHMCILSGCDYIEPFQGMTLNKAHQLISIAHDANPETFLDALPKLLNMPPNFQVTREYKRNFMMVDAIYRHQIIFDPFNKKLEPLFDPHIAGTYSEYCKNAGEIYDKDKAYQLALGNLHPVTLKRLNDWDPKEADLTNKSIWGPGPYERSPSRNQQKDSFKEYFSNYKFETIQETDVDDSTLKTEDENMTNIRREFNSEVSSNQSLSAFLQTDNYDDGRFPMSRNCQPLPPFDSVCKYPGSLPRAYPMPGSVPETRMSQTVVPGFVPQTKMPRSVSQTKMSGSVPVTNMPGTIPQTRMPRSASQTNMSGSVPQINMRGTPPQTRMLRSASQTKMSGSVPQANMRGTPPQTRMPGSLMQTNMSGSVPQVKMPGSAPTTNLPSCIPQTVVTGFIPIHTMMPGVVPQTMMPGVVPHTIMPGVVPHTMIPGVVPHTMIPGFTLQPVTPSCASQSGFGQSTSMPGADLDKATPSMVGVKNNAVKLEEAEDYIRQFSALDFVETVYDKEISDQKEEDIATKETEN